MTGSRPAGPAADLLLRRELDRYDSALRLWVDQVRRARSVGEAFRRAGQKPARSGMLHAAGSIARSAERRAEIEIERTLETFVAAWESRARPQSGPTRQPSGGPGIDVPPLSPALKRDLLRSTGGVFPRLAHRISRLCAEDPA